jgi:hypothetical protein
MALFNFRRKEEAAPATGALEAFLKGYSIEVMPRTAEKVEDFRDILPTGTRVYIAHIEGTPIEDMVATAARLRAKALTVMPHFPARIIKDKATLRLGRPLQGRAGVRQGLILAGNPAAQVGDFSHSSMELLESGAFTGFDRLHVAGHPEGNKDIDPDGSDRMVMEAARWKSAFAERTDAKMAMATQFCFEAQPVIDWVNRLAGRRHQAAGPHRHRGPCETPDPHQVRHRLRRRPVAPRAAKAGDGRDQASPALRADRSPGGAGRPQGREPRFRDRTGPFLPPWRHQDQCHLGHRTRRRFGRSGQRHRLRERFKNDPYRR